MSDDGQGQLLDSIGYLLADDFNRNRLLCMAFSAWSGRKVTQNDETKPTPPIIKKLRTSTEIAAKALALHQRRQLGEMSITIQKLKEYNAKLENDLSENISLVNGLKIELYNVETHRLILMFLLLVFIPLLSAVLLSHYYEFHDFEVNWHVIVAWIAALVILALLIHIILRKFTMAKDTDKLSPVHFKTDLLQQQLRRIPQPTHERHRPPPSKPSEERPDPVDILRRRSMNNLQRAKSTPIAGLRQRNINPKPNSNAAANKSTSDEYVAKQKALIELNV